MEWREIVFRTSWSEVEHVVHIDRTPPAISKGRGNYVPGRHDVLPRRSKLRTRGTCEFGRLFIAYPDLRNRSLDDMGDIYEAHRRLGDCSTPPLQEPIRALKAKQTYFPRRLLVANAPDEQKIQFRRRQNTLAARRTRKRKSLHLQELEEAVEHLKREEEVWKARALALDDLLDQHGLACPDDFLDK
ncbi:hypothetical protein B0H13DRAFT_2343821 [Mycena leptocephala]|nr:hypothetical protein B0H13DRAFT_2343821 [Mycena leptocephala]